MDAKNLSLLNKMPDELAEYVIQSALNFVNKIKPDFDSNQLLSVYSFLPLDL